jgi:hypothetical protein
MKQHTPTETPISTGVVITTAEAVTTRNLIIGLMAVDLKETHSDLSQLPFGMPQVWEAR